MRTILTLVALALAASAVAAPSSWNPPAPARLVLIADIHGDFDALLTILKSRDLIDDNGRWKGGRTHLQFLGDLNDRGPDTRLILDYLADLRKRAASAGGVVNALVGNHEAMVAEGMISYVSEGEAQAFSTFAETTETTNPLVWKNRLATQAENYRAHADYLMTKYGDPTPPFSAARYLGINRAYFGNSPYVSELLSRASVRVIGETLVVHAGVGEWLIDHSPEELNKMVHDWIAYYTGGGPKPSLASRWIIEDVEAGGSAGPLWDRATNDGRVSQGLIDRILKKYGAKRIVVGHSVQKNFEVREAYMNKVYFLDTGNSTAYGGKLSSIEITGERVHSQVLDRPPSTNGLRERVIQHVNHPPSIEPFAPPPDLIAKNEPGLTPLQKCEPSAFRKLIRNLTGD